MHNLKNWTFSEAEQVQGADGGTVYRVQGTERSVGEYHGMQVNHMGWPAGSVTGEGVTPRDALIDAVRQATISQVRQDDAHLNAQKWAMGLRGF